MNQSSPSLAAKILTRPHGVVAACTVGNAMGATPMVYAVFGLFLIPLSTEFGWSRSSVSLILLILAITSALCYPVIGHLVDRYGFRRITLAGNLLFATSIASVSFIGDNILHLYLAYAFIGFAATIPSAMMYNKVIASWFDHNKGLFFGISGGLGNGVGAALTPILVLMLLSNYGWRVGYQGLAICIVLIGFPVLFLLLREPPKNVRHESSDADTHGEILKAPQGMTLKQASQTSEFWIILSAIGLGAGCLTAIFAHIVPMLIDRELPAEKATTVLVTFSMVTAGWQLGLGYLLDRVPKTWIAAPFYLVALAGLIFLQFASAYPLLILVGVLLGFGLGTAYGVLPYFLSHYFGVKHYGVISSVAYAAIVLAQGIAPFLMALVFDMTGSYSIAISLIAFGLIAGAALMLKLKPFEFPAPPDLGAPPD